MVLHITGQRITAADRGESTARCLTELARRQAAGHIDRALSRTSTLLPGLGSRQLADYVWPTGAEPGGLLEGQGDGQQALLGAVGRDKLDSHRQAVGGEAGRQRDGG